MPIVVQSAQELSSHNPSYGLSPGLLSEVCQSEPHCILKRGDLLVCHWEPRFHSLSDVQHCLPTIADLLLEVFCKLRLGFSKFVLVL